ncbi:MAG: metallophosphoesterase [Clostridia bacterium]|nr:metallophosphoesterase [Clostridia bacterium]
MNVYAISDLHLSTAVEKPMDIFGDGWQNHFEKISANWKSKVTDDDVVLIGGDISWGISIEEAAPDFALLKDLPGKKIVLRGNHDYYWNSVSKMRLAFPDFKFLQNNCIRMRNLLVVGTRGWNLLTADSTDEDKKIYEREIIRLKLSLDSMKEMRTDEDTVVALLHYPPFNAAYDNSEITEILKEYKVDKVLYGHLHGKNVRVTPVVNKDGISYYLTSCDLVDNKLIEVAKL